MLGVLALLFLVVPVAELYVIVQVSHGIGIGETIVLLIAVSIVGAWLAKWQGLAVLRRMQRTVAQGKVPSGDIVDGALVLFAAALMITPGFLSDCLAILLLVPPTRAIARGAILRRIRAGSGLVSAFPGFGRAPRADDVWDVEGWEDPPRPPSPPSLGR